MNGTTRKNYDMFHFLWFNCFPNHQAMLKKIVNTRALCIVAKGGENITQELLSFSLKFIEHMCMGSRREILAAAFCWQLVTCPDSGRKGFCCSVSYRLISSSVIHSWQVHCRHSKVIFMSDKRETLEKLPRKNS